MFSCLEVKRLKRQVLEPDVGKQVEWKDELDKRLGQEGDRVALGLLGAGGHVHLFWGLSGAACPATPVSRGRL